MRFGAIVPLVALLVLSLSGSAITAPKVQKECPGGLDLDGKEELLRKAPSCDAAMELFEACSYGASGDTGLSDAVIENCGKAFTGKLSKAQQKAYDAEVGRCNAKYRGKQGTMYVSAAAFCRAMVAQKYAQRFAKAAPASRK